MSWLGNFALAKCSLISLMSGDRWERDLEQVRHLMAHPVVDCHGAEQLGRPRGHVARRRDDIVTIVVMHLTDERQKASAAALAPGELVIAHAGRFKIVRKL